MRKILLAAAFAVAGLTGCKSKDARPAVPEDGAVWVNVNVNNYIHPDSKPTTTGGGFVVRSQEAGPPPPPPPMPLPAKPGCEPVSSTDSCGPDGCGIPNVNHAGSSNWPYVYAGLILGLFIALGIRGRHLLRMARSRRVRRGVAIAGSLLLAVSLAGCNSISRPALLQDVNDLREDTLKSAEAQRDAYKDHLVQNPGDLEGAASAAFGTNVSKQQELKEKRDRENNKMPEIPDFPYMPVGGGALGIIGIAWALVKRAIKKYDEEPLVAPDGRRLTEEQVVAGAIKAHEIKQG